MKLSTILPADLLSHINVNVYTLTNETLRTSSTSSTSNYLKQQVSKQPVIPVTSHVQQYRAYFRIDKVRRTAPSQNLPIIAFHGPLSYDTILICNFSIYTSRVQSAKRKLHCLSRNIRSREREGFLPLDQQGRLLANQIGRNSRVLQGKMELPALTYTCTDSHISHPGNIQFKLSILYVARMTE